MCSRTSVSVTGSKCGPNPFDESHEQIVLSVPDGQVGHVEPDHRSLDVGLRHGRVVHDPVEYRVAPAVLGNAALTTSPPPRR